MASSCCRHWDEKSAHSAKLTATKPQVYKEECMYCFRDWEEPNWIDVCVVCMQGFCQDHFSIHTTTNPSHNCSVRASMRTIHEDAQNIKSEDESQGTPCKELKVEIPAITTAYDHTFVPYCHDCRQQLSVTNDRIIEYIKDSVEASKIIESAWAEKRKECEHVKNLQQSNPQSLLNMSSCSNCELTENLWLCLSCGELGCGRRQFDGSGGNGHASSHYLATRHPCSVKLGTLKNANPDVHCYACDEMILDSHLDKHLNLFNINRSLINPEKGIDELQFEQNVNFQMTSEDGKQFEAAVGVHGIHNLGNSCYLASVIQPIVRLMTHTPSHDPSLCNSQPKDCLQCQFTKLRNGLLAGESEVFKIRPWMFKRLIGKGHEEFSSSRQQDAVEFFAHLLKSLKLYDLFSIGLQQTLTCQDCGFVSAHIDQADYLQTTLNDSKEPVSLDSLIMECFASERVDVKCSKCHGENVVKKYGITSGPKDCLVVVIGRSMLKNWVPVKVDTSISLPQSIDLAPFMEDIIEFKPDPSAMEQLQNMGFSQDLCAAALKKHENKVEDALNALLSGELQSEQPANIDEMDIAELLSMGFDQELVVKALKKTGSKEAACELLLTDPSSLFDDNVSGGSSSTGKTKLSLYAFVSHKGSSLHCGHYIVHVKVDGRWLMFNDDRVVIVPDDQVDHAQAYMAFYS